MGLALISPDHPPLAFQSPPPDYPAAAGSFTPTACREGRQGNSLLAAQNGGYECPGTIQTPRKCTEEGSDPSIGIPRRSRRTLSCGLAPYRALVCVNGMLIRAQLNWPSQQGPSSGLALGFPRISKWLHSVPYRKAKGICPPLRCGSLWNRQSCRAILVPLRRVHLVPLYRSRAEHFCPALTRRASNLGRARCQFHLVDISPALPLLQPY